MNALSRLIAAFFLLAIFSAARAETVAGRWEGRLHIPDREFDLIIDLDPGDGKEWTGSIIIPGLGVKGAPLTEIAIGADEISFTIKGALENQRLGPAKFTGHLGAAGKLTGDFLQAGNIAPFELRKTGPAQVEQPPRSTAIASDFEGIWKGDYEMLGYPRHVTLTLTNHAAGPSTAKLLIVGKRTTDATVDFVTEANGYLIIKSQEFGITYEGRLRKDNGEIDGTFALGPYERPLRLHKAP